MHRPATDAAVLLLTAIQTKILLHPAAEECPVLPLLPMQDDVLHGRLTSARLPASDRAETET